MAAQYIRYRSFAVRTRDYLRSIYAERDLFQFIESGISTKFKLSLAIYILIYRVVSPAVSVQIYDVNVDLFWERILVSAFEQLVIFFPIFFWKRIGFFHVLAFPALLTVAFDVAFSPLHLLLPFVLSAKPMLGVSPSWAASLTDLSGIDYSYYNILLSCASMLFLVCKYIGFHFGRKTLKFSTRVRFPSYQLYLVHAVVFFVVFAILFGMAFIVSRGGISAQLLSFNEGRYLTTQGNGALTVVVKLASIALMLWVAKASNAIKSPIFIGLFIALVPVYWIVDGSRSSIMLLVLSLIVIYSFSSKRIPYSIGVAAALFAFLIFGLLGIVRQNYSAKEVDYGAFSLSNTSQWAEASRAETIKRSAEEGDLAGFVAADKGEFLYGMSYLSVIAYPVPRAIWSQKPKNIFYYNAWVAFSGNSMKDSAPEIWGIPINEYAEAYWNFGWLGVAVIGGLVGLFLGGLTSYFSSKKQSAAVAIFYLISLLYFTGGSRAAFYWIQYTVGIMLITGISIAIYKIKFRR